MGKIILRVVGAVALLAAFLFATPAAAGGYPIMCTENSHPANPGPSSFLTCAQQLAGTGTAYPGYTRLMDGNSTLQLDVVTLSSLTSSLATTFNASISASTMFVLNNAGTAFSPLQLDANGVLPVADLSYDSTSDATRNYDVNPAWEQYVPLDIANETNKANGTYYYYIPMNESREFGVQLILTGTITVTVEASNEPDCAPASCTYGDVSNDWYGAASWNASAFLTDTGRVAGQAKYVRIKVVTAGGGTDDYEIYGKRLF
jgi:hypothetical protein